MRMRIIEQFLRDIFRAEMNPLHASSSVHIDPESRNFKDKNTKKKDRSYTRRS